MKASRKVVWAEGVMLGQQHFQQWEAYLQNQQRLFFTYAHPEYWGIAELEWDESFLAQGVIRLNRCLVLLKDRRWLDFDHHHDEPLTLTIPENATHTLSVFLLLPETEKVAGINGYPESDNAAWQGVYQSVHDVYDSNREREVLVAKPNLRLMLAEGMPDSNVSVIKLAELEYNSQQQAYRFNRNFFPAALQMRAYPQLGSWLDSFVGKLAKYIKRLSEQKEKHSHAHSSFGYGDFIYFNLTKTLVTHWSKLCSLQQLLRIHPFYLYEACTVLFAELQGYLSDPLSQKPLPPYKHDALNLFFMPFERDFDGLMLSIMPTNTLDVVLNRVSDTQYQSSLLQERDLTDKQFCLALYHENLTQELIDQILARVKVSAPSQLHHIMHSFTPGIELKYLAIPGKDLLTKRNYHYFLLDKTSKGWADVAKEAMVSFFISQDLASLQFELICYE